MISFVWYWTFWHWSKESFQSGSVLHSPLQGIGTYWDEWFHHEASDNDLRAIEQVGLTKSSQQQFVLWLHRHWAKEMPWRNNRTVTRFVLGQLATLAPFNQWTAFGKYRTVGCTRGISAIILAEGSSGEVTDIRKIGVVTLPADHATAASRVLTGNFRTEREDVETPLKAAENVLAGKGLLIFLALWISGGRRSYPSWLKFLLNLGWLTSTGLILFLLLGSDPGQKLTQLVATLAVIWSALVLIAFMSSAAQIYRAWQAGKFWRAQLERSQVRLCMAGGLTVKGGSAGLSFCLNTLHSLYRAWPGAARQSWIWRRFFHRLQTEAGSWAATGVITPDGFLKPVVLDQKIRACRKHPDIQHVLTPRQPDTGRATVSHATKEPDQPIRAGAVLPPFSPKTRLGFAAERSGLHIHACRHLAQSLFIIGDFFSGWQLAVNALAIIISLTLLAAASDMRAILLPFQTPKVVAPGSPTPRYLWVSLDTSHPRYFSVSFESGFWANRHADVSFHDGENASVRAEIPLLPLADKTTVDENDGTVWIERRQHFLSREFISNDRVGRYTLRYLTNLGSQ